MKAIRATLENGDGDVLFDAEFDRDQVLAAMAERFPDEAIRNKQLGKLLVEYDTGVKLRPFRISVPRVVGRTVYL